MSLLTGFLPRLWIPRHSSLSNNQHTPRKTITSCRSPASHPAEENLSLPLDCEAFGEMRHARWPVSAHCGRPPLFTLCSMQKPSLPLHTLDPEGPSPAPAAWDTLPLRSLGLGANATPRGAAVGLSLWLLPLCSTSPGHQPPQSETVLCVYSCT